MQFLIEIDIDKEKFNSDGKSINAYDFIGLINAIQGFDKDYLKVLNIKSTEREGTNVNRR